MSGVVVRLLGPVEVDGASVQAGRVSALFSLLALDSGTVVSADRLVDELWGDDRPASGVSALYVYISRLRKQLESSPVSLAARAPGYAMTTAGTDVELFERLVATAETEAAAARWTSVASGAREALGLWRGEPFAGASPSAELTRAAGRLDRLRRRARTLEAEALLQLGRTAESLEVARRLVEEDGLDEGVVSTLMRAAAAAGRRGEALAAFEAFRRDIRDELGLDPSAELRRIHTDLLLLDDAAEVADEGLVGRDDERDLLTGAVAQLGRLVILEGEPGIGKTRLAEFATAEARARDIRVVWARASAGAGTPSLWLWELVLSDLSRAHDEHPRSGADILGELAGAERDATSRFRLWEGIAARVLEATRREPILLVLDDLQWADEGSLQTLQLLAQNIRARRIAIVVTVRTGHARSATIDTILSSLARDDIVDRLRLAPFSLEAVARFAEASGSTDDATRLLERSGGNPFYLSELVAAGGDPRALPSTVSDLVAQRLAAFDERTLEVLRVASVAARRIDLPVVAASVGITPLEAATSLHPAIEDGIVRADGASLTFAHDLMRDAIGASVDLGARAALHARIADGIAAVHGEFLEAHVDELADHLFEAAGGNPSIRAYGACMQAANAALARLAFDRAAMHRGRALALLAGGDENREVRWQVLLQLTIERRSTGDVEGALASWRQAMSTARRIGDPARVRRTLALLGSITLWNWRHFAEVDLEAIGEIEAFLAQPQTDADRAELLGTLAVERYFDGDQERNVALAAEAVDLARSTGDVPLRVRTLNNLMVSSFYPGQESARLAAAVETLSLPDVAPQAEGIALLQRAYLSLRFGDARRCEDDVERASWLIPRLGYPENEAQLECMRGGLAIMRGELDEAEELIEYWNAMFRRTTLWGAEFTAVVQRLHLAHVRGTEDQVLAKVVDVAMQDQNRIMRWAAVNLMAQTGDHRGARSLISRWGLRAAAPLVHWASDWEWEQAAEATLLLDLPHAPELYRRLSVSRDTVLTMGTASSVLGPAGTILARLAESMGDVDAAAEHRAKAADLTASVAAGLGRAPVWTL